MIDHFFITLSFFFNIADCNTTKVLFVGGYVGKTALIHKIRWPTKDIQSLPYHNTFSYFEDNFTGVCVGEEKLLVNLGDTSCE